MWIVSAHPLVVYALIQRRLVLGWLRWALCCRGGNETSQGGNFFSDKHTTRPHRSHKLGMYLQRRCGPENGAPVHGKRALACTRRTKACLHVCAHAGIFQATTFVNKPIGRSVSFVCNASVLGFLRFEILSLPQPLCGIDCGIDLSVQGLKQAARTRVHRFLLQRLAHTQGLKRGSYFVSKEAAVAAKCFWETKSSKRSVGL